MFDMKKVFKIADKEKLIAESWNEAIQIRDMILKEGCN